jgi:ribonuclease HI/probable phosphoglycerate mutase
MDKQTVIRELATKLTDKALKQIFPDTPARTIRNLLLDRSTEPVPPSSTIHSETTPEKITDCRLYTDGASRGNPGLAGAGAVILDEAGHELLAEAEYLGTCTNNAAEYQALILGLQSARTLGCSRLHVFLDSELIVRQVTGRYKVKNATLKPLFSQVQKLLKEFKGYTIAHVPREKNKRADELANQGIDNR